MAEKLEHCRFAKSTDRQRLGENWYSIVGELKHKYGLKDKGALYKVLQRPESFDNAQKRAQQSAQPQDMIEVSMCEKNAGKVLKARTRLQNLALSPFPAVDQKTIFIMLDDLCRKTTLCRRRGGGRAKKKYFEQMESFGDNICHRELERRNPKSPDFASQRESR